MKNIFNRLPEVSKKEKYIVAVAMLLLTVCFLLILPDGHDIEFHMYRIGTMATQLANNPFQLPIRILSASFNGYGYAVPLFYGDLFLYLPALLVACGLEVAFTYQLTMVCIWYAGFAAMYYAIKRVSGQAKFAFYAAVCYGFSPYFLINLYERAAVGESLAFVIVPLVFAAFYRMVHQQKTQDWLLLALGMTALLLSHTLSTILTVIVLAIWALCKYKAVFQKGTFLALLGAVALTLGLTASFLLPMLQAMTYQTYGMASDSSLIPAVFASRILQPWSFLYPALTRYQIFSFLAGEEIIMYGIYYNPGGTGWSFVLMLALYLWYRKRVQHRAIQWLLVLSLMVYAVMFSSTIITAVSSVLVFLQFPWRLLSLPTIGCAVVCGYLLWRKAQADAALAQGAQGAAEGDAKQRGGKKRFWARLCCLPNLMLLIICIGLNAFFIYFPQAVYYQYSDYSADFSYLEYSPNKADALYLPVEATKGDYETRGEVVLCNNQDVDYTFVREGNELVLTVGENPHADTVLELPLYLYLGYSAKDAQGNAYEITKSEDGLVEVQLGSASDVSITVSYTGTAVQHVSDAITALTLAGLAGWWFVKRRRRKPTH